MGHDWNASGWYLNTGKNSEKNGPDYVVGRGTCLHEWTGLGLVFQAFTRLSSLVETKKYCFLLRIIRS